MNPKVKKVTAIIVGLLLSAILVFFGFQLVQGVFTRASDERPQDVVITDLADRSAKISWTTGSENSGVIQYGTSPASLTSFVPEESPNSKDHTVELTLLSPNTTYYFEIVYGENRKYDNGGVPWTFTTKDESEAVSKSQPTSTAELKEPDADEPEPTAGVCPQTDCIAIRAKIGKGCSTQEYIRCIKSEANPSPVR